MLRKLATARRMGLRGAVGKLATRLRDRLWTRETLVVFRMQPEQLNPIAPQLSGHDWALHSAPAEEVLTRESAQLPAGLVAELRTRRPDRRVHWAEVRGSIVSWGFSTPAEGSWPLTEVRSELTVPPGGICLTAFETLPDYRGRRLYPAVLTRILQERFGEGAPMAFIWCRRENVASYRAIERVGFQVVSVHEYARRLGIVTRSETTPSARTPVVTGDSSRAS